MAATASRREEPTNKSSSIQWAPLNIPWPRRLQTLAAFGFVIYFAFGQVICFLVYIYMLFSSMWWLALGYAAWMYLDINTCDRGGRKIQWVRNWTWWRYFRDYFPTKLIKTADLDPSKNYLFACFPHGILICGAFSSFWTNALNFHQLFPGMTISPITLRAQFLLPIYREFMLGQGACSASKESLLHLLNPKNYVGKCVALMVGGAAELLNSHPGQYKLTLSRRKGFVRIAMQSGASLVPVFSFGEPDVFCPASSPEQSYTRWFQEKVKQITSYIPVIPQGRGIFQYSFGIVPFRSPIVTVVGKPMEVVKNSDPSDEEINIVHAEFIKRLTELFESEKSKYLKDHEKVQLIIQ